MRTGMARPRTRGTRRGTSEGPRARAARHAGTGDPADDHRGIRRDCHSRGQPRARGTIRARHKLGHRAEHHGRARTRRVPVAPAHERRTHSHRRRLSPLRDLDLRRGEPGPGRAAHDPAPVRPGRIHLRAMVPAGRGHARRHHPRSRSGHAGQAGTRPAASRRPRAGRRPHRRAGARARGGLGQAVPAAARGGRQPGDAGPRRAQGQRAARRPHHSPGGGGRGGAGAPTTRRRTCRSAGSCGASRRAPSR